MGKQKLSPKAAAAKAERDLIAALTPLRRAKKRDSQQKHRDNPSAGAGKDYDHKTGAFTSVKKNRGNSGNGTKQEKGASYHISPKKQ